MSEEKNKSNDDLSREEINEELKKVKDEDAKQPGFLDVIKWPILGPILGPTLVTCYTICGLPFSRDKFKKFGYSKTCPQCHVELQPDPEEKYDFRCPKCGKGFNNSDLSDSN